MNSENKKQPFAKAVSYVDLTGFAPVSLGTNTKMLLHTLQAQVHEEIINKKNLFCKRFFRLVPIIAHSV